VTEAALRLFPNYDSEDLLAPAARPFLLTRLLEDGDGADLRALFGELPETAAAAWLAAHGGRQLSVRSCTFWQIVLGTGAGPTAPDTGSAPALWPL